ncbi:hypothetical protein [Actinomadura rubrisoli]|uniref:Uncharacterized protein n=1 Tax=Actinomadura rubrisoli TaxID=2530368 RepID=A0A4R4ZVN4_9ACTN|nr:hypothetical protein [Actinomadura rubrisoli]TDD62274.1 hypothetical protein E1298_44745 [Actinomadura rubrisoli]
MIATDYLDLLARALATDGWAARPRYEQAPERLHVLSPSLPTVGESIRVKAGVGGVLWFIDSTGDPIAPCHDLPRAVAEIGARLAPDAIAAGVRRAAGAERDATSRGLISRLRTSLGRAGRA